MTVLARRTFLIAVASSALAAACGESARGAKLGPLLAPAALAARMDDVKQGKVAVLYVGPEVLFQLGHVPGARYIGPAGEDEGLKALERALAALPPDAEAVLYCGCCPVADCPNVRPASALIAKLGRPRTYLLDLPTRFSTDWIEKGYPVEPR